MQGADISLIFLYEYGRGKSANTQKRKLDYLIKRIIHYPRELPLQNLKN